MPLSSCFLMRACGKKRVKSRPSSIIRRPLTLRIRFWRWSKAGRFCHHVTSVFRDDGRAHTNDELKRLDEAFSYAELAALSNDIYLNSALFARVDAVWQQRHSLGLDDEVAAVGRCYPSAFLCWRGAQLAEG
ncbi:hypothetical protein KCP70_24060 [Salmonella enterica subsp. enterica]|nr:hypothetical protein KCP70_24060 [Salmonella enterica subsp. enterica]